MSQPPMHELDIPPWQQDLLKKKFSLTITPDLAGAQNSPIVPRFTTWWPHDWSAVKVVNDKWQVNVDVQHFTPEEVSVKIVNGNVIVQGKHDEKPDELGYVSRQFVRRFALPEGVESGLVESRLSSDGVLTVVAPSKEDIVAGERTVPITFTGPVRKDMAELDKKPEDSPQEEPKQENVVKDERPVEIKLIDKEKKPTETIAEEKPVEAKVIDKEVKPAETKKVVEEQKPAETKNIAKEEKPAETKCTVKEEKPAEPKNVIKEEKPAVTKNIVKEEKPVESNLS